MNGAKNETLLTQSLCRMTYVKCDRKAISSYFSTRAYTSIELGLAFGRISIIGLHSRRQKLLVRMKSLLMGGLYR